MRGRDIVPFPDRLTVEQCSGPGGPGCKSRRKTRPRQAGDVKTAQRVKRVISFPGGASMKKGETRSAGPALKLLNLLADKGLQGLL